MYVTPIAVNVARNHRSSAGLVSMERTCQTWVRSACTELLRTPGNLARRCASVHTGWVTEASRAEAPELLATPHFALTAAPTAGVRLFARRPPVHSIVLGRCQLVTEDAMQRATVTAIPANVPHTLMLETAYAAVAYLDARYFRFEDVRRLAEAWRGFVPGADRLHDAFGDALKLPRRRLDGRLLRALDALDDIDATVSDSAARVGLSESRLTHLMVEELGAPPRTWRAWLRLRRAISATMSTGANLTRAAHEAGFTDSAHLTRTSKQLAGVLPSQMLPRSRRAGSQAPIRR